MIYLTDYPINYYIAEAKALVFKNVRYLFLSSKKLMTLLILNFKQKKSFSFISLKVFFYRQLPVLRQLVCVCRYLSMVAMLDLKQQNFTISRNLDSRRYHEIQLLQLATNASHVHVYLDFSPPHLFSSASGC